MARRSWQIAIITVLSIFALGSSSALAAISLDSPSLTTFAATTSGSNKKCKDGYEKMGNKCVREKGTVSHGKTKKGDGDCTTFAYRDDLGFKCDTSKSRQKKCQALGGHAVQSTNGKHCVKKSSKCSKGYKAIEKKSSKTCLKPDGKPAAKLGKSSSKNSKPVGAKTNAKPKQGTCSGNACPKPDAPKGCTSVTDCPKAPANGSDAPGGCSPTSCPNNNKPAPPKECPKFRVLKEC